MESPSRIEDRFDKAILRVCRQWECLECDSGGQTFHGVADDLKNAVEKSGGVEAVRLLLKSASLSEAFLELWARHRLDLTMEALCLRPVWSELFTTEERGTAAKWLTDALVFTSSGVLVPPYGADPYGADLGPTVTWLNEQLIWWEHDLSLPQRCDLSDIKQLSWCECIAERTRELAEFGCLAASLEQCSHYRSCLICAARWPHLGSFLIQFENNTFNLCRKVLKVLITCVHRVPDPIASRAAGSSEIAWRAIVCAAGAFEQNCVWDVHSALEANNELDPGLKQLFSTLTEDEVCALHLAEAAAHVFIEVQWSLFERDGPIYLPTDGDLSPIPGVVEVLQSNDLSEWTRLMTGSDPVFKGTKTTYVDGYGLFTVLMRATLFARNIGRSNPALPLRDSTDSVSANVQEPDLGIDEPLRERAEKSLRETLGDAVYRSLCPAARNAAITAEYCWLDANFPDPSKIVADLATAFERQLKEGILKPFCQFLIASGARNYPEPDGPVCGGAVRTVSSGRPKPGVPSAHGQSLSLPKPSLPKLLTLGRFNDTLTLGSMVHLLNCPLESMLRYFGEFDIDLERVVKVSMQVRNRRNQAVHEGGVLREEAEDVRLNWLSGRDANIFTALLPKTREAHERQARSPGIRTE